MTAIAGASRARAWLWLCLAVILPATAACRAGPADVVPARNDGGMQMTAHTGAGEDGRADLQWTARNKLARLQGGFALDADGRTLRVTYRLTNIGPYPLLVFDRGDALSVATRRQSPGSVGVPQVQFEAGDLTLRHVARPLREPTPTAPPSPLVSQVLPGGEYGNHFAHVLPDAGSGPVRRVRYCQGAIGVPEPLPDSEQRAGGVWSVPNAAAAHQGILCSPWLDVATGKLVSGS